MEMQRLRKQYLGRVPSQAEIYRALLPYLSKQFVLHWTYKLGVLKS
jgi:hypothetical protein